jgi:hypothetical protein
MKKRTVIPESYRTDKKINVIKNAHRRWNLMQQRAISAVKANNLIIQTSPSFSLRAALSPGALIAFMIDRASGKDNLDF